MKSIGYPVSPGCGTKFFGVIFLRSCDHDFVIFDAEALQRPQINSEGHLTLTSLRHSIPVEDKIVIFPWFIELKICTMSLDTETLWKAELDDMDKFICRTIQCPFSNFLDVNFAVYHDAVEAHFDIYFVHFENEGEDALIQVHGTVSASNTSLSHPNAKSFLFHKLGEECVSLKSGILVPLPLSRRITVVPRQSTLLVHVSIDVGTELGIEGTVKFNPSSGSAEESIISPNSGKVLVKVSWVDCQTLDGDGNNHLIKEEDVAPQEGNFMDALAGEGEHGLQESNVMDCFRDSKVRRSEYQTDVHTRYESRRNQFKDEYERVSWDDEAMWDDHRGGKFDTFLSKRIHSQFGLIEVNYAVYLNGVEARVDVTLTDCQFSSAVVYGLITAQNSKFCEEEARSFLFNRDKSEGIRIDVSPYKGKVAKLPLSRSKTVHPIGSVVTITLNIWQSSIVGTQDQLIAKNKILEFTRLSGRDVRTFQGDACEVEVAVVWAETSEPINGQCPYV